MSCPVLQDGRRQQAGPHVAAAPAGTGSGTGGSRAVSAATKPGRSQRTRIASTSVGADPAAITASARLPAAITERPEGGGRAEHQASGTDGAPSMLTVTSSRPPSART